MYKTPNLAFYSPIVPLRKKRNNDVISESDNEERESES